MKDIAILFIAMLALGSSSISLWHQYHHPHVVSVDILYLSNHAKSVFNSPQKIKKFSRRMEKTIRALASQRHLIIIPKQVAMAGVPDITVVVENRLFQ